MKQSNTHFLSAGAANLAWWDLTGTAQLAETVIRLTTDEPHRQGAIWNNYVSLIFFSQLKICISDPECRKLNITTKN